jgi:hypothetical protein
MTCPFSFTGLRMVVFCALLPLGSCASNPELDLMLHESPQGAVYLERIPDRSFQAAHPIRIDQDTITRVLQGILVKENQGLLQNFLAGQSQAISAFSEDEVRYLAPLLAEGLTRAAVDQQIGFRLIRTGSSGAPQLKSAGSGASHSPGRLALMETSRGSMYAYGRSLYVTVLEYHVRSERTDSITKASRLQSDHTGLTDRTLSFTPESVSRPDSYRGKNATKTTLVIDYESLSAFPTRTPAHELPPPLVNEASPQRSPSLAPDAGRDAPLRLLQEQMNQKNRELEDLRRELQDIRRQMREPATAVPAPVR